MVGRTLGGGSWIPARSYRERSLIVRDLGMRSRSGELIASHKLRPLKLNTKGRLACRGVQHLPTLACV